MCSLICSFFISCCICLELFCWPLSFPLQRLYLSCNLCVVRIFLQIDQRRCVICTNLSARSTVCVYPIWKLQTYKTIVYGFQNSAHSSPDVTQQQQQEQQQQQHQQQQQEQLQVLQQQLLLQQQMIQQQMLVR